MRLTKENIAERINNGILYVPNLDITSIEEFPIGLRKIHVSGNNLCHLPEIPEGVEELYCYDNNLIELPNIPESLKKLDIANNCIDDISFDKTITNNSVTINKVCGDFIDNLFESEYDSDDEDDEYNIEIGE